MADFIRREDALFALRKAERGGSMTALTRLERAYAEIRGMPAADVAEVVYGRWILHHTVTGNPYTECSNCCTDFAFKTDKGTFAKLNMRGMSYCPFCSAKMDGGNDNVSD